MNTHIQRMILTAIILITSVVAGLKAGELPYTWYVNANGREGTLEISTGPAGEVTGTLLDRPIQGWLVDRHLVLARQGDNGLESWEAWIATSGQKDQAPIIAGSFIRPDMEGTLPWFGTGRHIDQETEHDTLTQQPEPPAQAPASLPMAPAATTKLPPSTTIAPRLPGGQPSLAGAWQTPDGPLTIAQDGSKLVFKLPDRKVPGRLTGPNSLIGGFAPGCCKGHLEQAFTVIAWDNGTRWFRK